MYTPVTPPDDEAIVIAALRAAWDVDDGTVDFDVEEKAPRPDGTFVVVRSDGLSPLGLGMFSGQIGVRVAGAPDDLRGKATGDVARKLSRMIAALPKVRSGIAAVTDQLGPYRVPGTDTDRPEWYQTATLTWSVS